MHRLLLLSALASLAGAGCGRSRPQARQLPAWVFQVGQREPAPSAGQARVPIPAPRHGIHGQNEGADMVAAALQGAGLRFGTDGSVAALWGYLRTSHLAVPPPELRRGDVLFFDLVHPWRPDEETGAPLAADDRCDPPHHVGVVSQVERDGRITFVEIRDGRVRTSHADPSRPRLRRDEAGRIRNSFLRPKRAGEPPDLPVFAGEMLCGGARSRPRS